MVKNKIQEKRMKGYFIQATNEILRSEGLKNISARNIAKRAGYSYATLYNYFKDVKDLVFECVKDFQMECKEFIQVETKNHKIGLERILKIHLAYFKFFVQYPGIFELFYIEKTTDLAHEQSTVKMIDGFLEELTKSDWEAAIIKHKIEPETSLILQHQLKFFITGLLLSYLNRRYITGYSEIMEMLEKQLGYILEI